MGTPALVPMFGPDGQVANIPAPNVQSALAGGGKLAIHVYSPQGEPAYVPHDRLADALKAGATASPPQTAQDPQGFVQNLLSSSPAGVLRGLANNFTQGPQNPQEAAIQGNTPDSGVVARTLGHLGLGTYRTLLAPTVNNAKQAFQDAQSPNISDRMASGSEALQAIPIAGPVIQAGGQALRQAVGGDVSGGIGTVLGNLVTGGTAAALGGRLGETEPTNVPPQLAAARGVAKAVLPKEGDFNSYVDTLQREKGNVENYANQNGLTTNTPLNMSIAARQSANDLNNFYNEKLLGPNADQQVNIPMSMDQVGTRLPSGSRTATLQQVNDRVGQLNDLLRSAQNNATQGQTMTDLAKMQDLQNEKSALTDILHSKLGEANGISPDAVAGIRQSIGARYDLADQTLAGANRSSLSAGRLDRGISPLKGMTATQAALDLVNKMRGGPEVIANKVYQNAYPKLNVPAGVGNPASLDELRSSGISQFLK